MQLLFSAPKQLVWYWSHVSKVTINKTLKKDFDGSSKTTVVAEPHQCETKILHRKTNYLTNHLYKLRITMELE